MTDTEIGRRDFARTWDTADITVRDDGDGRTVEALITPFDAGTEIRDAEGWYDETIGRTAFDRTLAHRGLNFTVLFNHGKTYDGRTDGSLMVPIGAPRLLEAQDRGLYSETEYLDNPLADSILDAVKKGAIRGYSFAGTFVKSQRIKMSTRAAKGAIHRSEIAMREYGPVLFPAYAGASILGSRAQSFIEELSQLDPEDLDRFRQMLGIATPLGDPAAPDGTPTGPAVPAATDPADGHSTQQSTDTLRALIRSRNRRREIS